VMNRVDDAARQPVRSTRIRSEFPSSSPEMILDVLTIFRVGLVVWGRWIFVEK
jgi:hypothetical protein